MSNGILENLPGCPDRATLPAQWRKPVGQLERTIYAQATALQAAEKVLAEAADALGAGRPDEARRLLEHGHAEIGRLLGGEVEH